MLFDNIDVTEKGLVVRSTGEVIPADEPVMLLRATDPAARLALGRYAEICAGTARENTALVAASTFAEFTANHPERMEK